MKKWIAVISLGLAILAILMANAETKPDLAPSDVKITLNGGHGSGVHIGDGYIITAAHVVTQVGDYLVKDRNFKEYPAEVLWKNHVYDVALLRVKDWRFRASSLNCDVPFQGQKITATGNPFDLTFIETHGYIAGKTIQLPNWKEALIADLTLGPGMSGGPVFNERHEVVGINVGVRLHRMGLSASPTGFAVIVPASTVCKLMARA